MFAFVAVWTRFATAWFRRSFRNRALRTLTAPSPTRSTVRASTSRSN